MTADAGWHRTVRSEDLAQGVILPARAGDVALLLGRLSDGEAVAFAPTCPHEDTSLTEASIWQDQVRCFLHQYLYDPRTGENVFPARTAPRQNLWRLRPRYLPTYPVEERDGWVWVNEEVKPPPDAYDPAAEVPPPWAGPLTGDL
jgi:nitrite reductase/ring-hydroxylating ferredoxin subunit